MEKHIAKIYGQKVHLSYVLRSNSDIYIRRDEKPYKYETKIGDILIGEYELHHAPLSVGDPIYLHELDLHTHIHEVFISTNNEYLYYIEHTCEIVEDEETQSTYRETADFIHKLQIKQKNNEKANPKVEIIDEESVKVWRSLLNKVKSYRR